MLDRPDSFGLEPQNREHLRRIFLWEIQARRRALKDFWFNVRLIMCDWETLSNVP